MKLIPKLQQGDYIYKVKDTDGTEYHIHPSAIGAKNLEVTLPETTITAPRKYKYRSAYHPEDALIFANILTGNVLGRLSPTQNLRAIYDTFDKNLTTTQKLQSWFQGNNGVISDEYAQKHPYLSTGINMIGDVGAYTTIGALKAMPKWAERVQAQNTQEAIARWQGIQNAYNNGIKRTRVGDVEVDNPTLNYRVGTKEIVNDFLKTGIVRAGETNAQKSQTVGGIQLRRKETFQNPMFKQGSLWYQPSEEMNGLLVTSEPLVTATKTSAPAANNGVFTIEGKTFVNDFGGRRIMGDKQILDKTNTTAYIWRPNFGYRRVGQSKPPTMTWGKAQTIAQYSKTGSPYENIMGTGEGTGWISWQAMVRGLKGERFGKYLGGGSEQMVYEDLANPDKVLKIQRQSYSTPLEAKADDHRIMELVGRNMIPYQMQRRLTGFVDIKGRFHPVYSQQKMQPLEPMSHEKFQQDVMPRIRNMLREKGFTGDDFYSTSNGKVTITDLKPENMGFDSRGNFHFFDAGFSIDQ